MPRVALHLDADSSNKILWKALLDLGHDVTSTPADWIPRDASNEDQLLGATAQGRCVFTFNLRDFLTLSTRYQKHAGIILAAQSSWSLNTMIAALTKILTESRAEELVGQIRWLNDWALEDAPTVRKLTGTLPLEIAPEDYKHHIDEKYDR